MPARRSIATQSSFIRPERIATPLRRIGPKGLGTFTSISWNEALDEIATRWKAIIAESGPQALLGYAYSAHQGQINRHIVNGLFYGLGASRLQAGTVCDTCCETAWDLTLGPVGGADPESVVDSDLAIAWGCDLMAVNVHFWAKLEMIRRTGVKVVVIDPRRSRTAAAADWHLPIRIGADAALALGVVHILLRDGRCDREYLAAHTLGFDQWAREVIPGFVPDRVAAITGLPVADIEKFATMYGDAKRSFIRIGEGMTRLARGGQALRAVATLPAVTGAYGRRGGGALLLTSSSMDFNFSIVRKPPSGPTSARLVNHSLLGEALLNMRDPPLRGIFIAANNPAVTCPDAGKVRRGLSREDLFVVVHDPFLTDTAKYADILLPATTYLETEDFYRSYGSYYMQYATPAVTPQGDAWSNFRLAQALAARMGVEDRVFRMSEKEILPEFFRGATGEVEHRQSHGPLGRRSHQSRARGRPRISYRLGQARDLFRGAGTPGHFTHARLAARHRGGKRRGELAAAPSHRALLFSAAHRLFRRRLPAQARGRALLCAPSARGRETQSRQRPEGPPVQR